jgi:hypothetical protein
VERKSNVLARFVGWRHYSSFLTPPFTQSCANCSVVDSHEFRPFSKIVSLSVDSDNSNFTSRVIDLLLLSRPLTVLWTVVPIIVNPIERVFRGRFLAHVVKKVFEPFSAKPPTTNHDAPTSVPAVIAIRRAVTTVKHTSVRVALGFMGSVFSASIIRRCFAKFVSIHPNIIVCRFINNKEIMA